MNTSKFIEAIKIAVRDAAIDDTIGILESPPGRSPDKNLLKISNFYNQKSDEEKAMINDIIKSAVDDAVFGFLCVLDGDRSIESYDNKGKLELYFTKSGSEPVHLNNNRDLHDIYN